MPGVLFAKGGGLPLWRCVGVVFPPPDAMADHGVLDKFFTKVMADVLTSSRVR